MKTETKRNAIITKTVERDVNGLAIGVYFQCINGDRLMARIGALPHHLLLEAAAHGLSQKIGDAAAIQRNPETGQSATVSDKWQACHTVFNRLFTDGLWNAEREGNSQGTLLVRAIMRVKKLTREQVTAWLDKKSEEEKRELRKNPAIAKAILEIQAESADSNIDTDALLDELPDGDE
jgi:hypothetical protein